MTSPLKTDWLTVALLFLAGLFAAAQFGKISLTLPDLAALTNQRLPVLAILVSVVGLVGLVGGVMAGAVVAALGPRRVLLAAFALGAILSLAQALLPPFPILLGLRIFEGISHLGIVVAAPPIMAQVATDKDRPVVMSIWAMFFGVSFALAALIFPTVLASGGLGLLFVLHGVGLAAIGLALAPRLPKMTRAPLDLRPIHAHITAYGDPRTAAPGLGFVFYTICYVALLTLLPNALGQPSLGVTLPLISLIGTLGAGYIARAVPPHQIAVGGFVLAILGAFGLWLAIAGSATVLFLAMGLIPGASFAMIPHLNAEAPAQARATGVIAQMGNVGTVTGTPIFALMLTNGGVPGMLTLVAAFSAVGIAVTLALQALVKRKA